jgi:hypothetical protein
MTDLNDFRDSVAIVISSCDAFFDAWRPFNAFLKRFWPDCALPMFLLTNKLEVSSPRIQSIAVGPDRGWSSNLLAALKQLDFRHVLYFQEDYFLTGPVASTQLAQDFAEAIASDADSLCFRARSQPDAGFEALNDRYGVVPLGSDGRTRCQVTLWKRSALQSILRPGETAWDFEAGGSERTQQMRILSYRRRDNTPLPYLMSAISRGFWMPDAIELCRKHGVPIEPFFRPVYSPHPWQRRIRRALGRRRLERALRAQKDRVIHLP